VDGGTDAGRSPARRVNSHPDADPVDLLMYRTLPATQGDLYRLSRLLWVFVLLGGVLIAPSIVGRIQYQMTSAEERARLAVARENLQDFQLTQLSTAYRMLAQSVGPSVVSISTASPVGEGQGSGVIVDESGYLITNYHVVEGVRTAEVMLSDGRRGPATVIGVDPLIDIALLKTELDNLVAAEWGSSEAIQVGDLVWALGSPFGLQKSVTSGILSAKGRRGITNKVVQEFLQTDAAVNPGNSGGPLVNIEGKVIGINTAIIGPSYQGISFAIPSELVREAYDQLREKGFVLRGFLGVTPTKVSDHRALRLGLERDRGVLVANVDPNTPAAAGGIRRMDVILSWNDQEFSDPVLLSQAIAATPIGTKVPLQIARMTPTGLKQLELEVVVAARPPSN
jgi:serine protease Do